jgi:hypothetical protein
VIPQIVNRYDSLCDTVPMIIKIEVVMLGVVLLFSTMAFRQYEKGQSSGPAHSGDATLNYPEHYRDWVYLTTGFDMSYNPGMQTDHHVFDNVFVNPEAYKAFVETGAWPDKTMLVLEVRGAEGNGSINRKGNFQGATVMGLEVHLKDEARFPGNWAFFSFDKGTTAKMISASSDCYSCHAAHAAVDTTFVQFYPTLLPIAQRKGTLSSAYLKDVEAPAQWQSP